MSEGTNRGATYHLVPFMNVQFYLSTGSTDVLGGH